mgnify:CR=1 FL=1
MNLHEYQGKEIFRDFAIPTPRGYIIENIDEADSIVKKAQKDFLRLVFIKGLDSACEDITSWRKVLIKEDILNLLR